jgi:5'-nucleotidase
MPSSKAEPLVVGVSTRALFDLTEEDRIYRRDGLEAFSQYQIDHEDEVLKPGAAFHLTRALQLLNNSAQRRVEVVIISQNHPHVFLRVSNSIAHHGLDVKQSALTAGAPILPLLDAFKVDLFFSASEQHVRLAIEKGFAAALVISAPSTTNLSGDEVRIAFDGDCVLFSDESELISRREGLPAFYEHEKKNARVPLGRGPFASFLQRLSELQKWSGNSLPVKTALVTARGFPAHERALRTLRHWGVGPDEAYFLNGSPKRPILEAFRPHIYFDDHEELCREVGLTIPVGQVPNHLDELVRREPVYVCTDRRADFLTVCKMYLDDEYPKAEKQFSSWYSSKLKSFNANSLEMFIHEVQESAEHIPLGDQRRAAGRRNTKSAKLLNFLENCLWKHQSTN